MPLRPAFASVLALALGLPLSQGRLLTASDGRTIDAEVVGFEGTDKVTVKRADTGQTFTLPVSSFGETDRKALAAEAAEAAKKPQALPAGALSLELSRVRFETRKEKQDVTLSGGEVRKEGVTVTEDDWGYSITLRNAIARPIENLRGEYILFVKVDTAGDDAARGDGRLKRTRRKLAFDPIPVGGRVSARTEAITARKLELAKGIVWGGTGDSKTRDTLQGIWLRIYQGDTLVLESASPGTLVSTESWQGGGS